MQLATSAFRTHHLWSLRLQAAKRTPASRRLSLYGAHGLVGCPQLQKHLVHDGCFPIFHRCRHPAVGGSERSVANRDAAPSPYYVKVCGITCPEDAQVAAIAGANLVGMILWPKATRSVSVETAQRIAVVARQHGATPVAVFVDENAEDICEVCEAATINVAQLHGEGARASLINLPPTLRTIFVMHADQTGRVHTSRPPVPVNWILIDSMKGGSGATFDWTAVTAPTESARDGWLLAGGLNPGNVADAVRIAQPTGVDVSSGVCGASVLRKDCDRVKQFVRNAVQAYSILR